MKAHMFHDPPLPKGPVFQIRGTSVPGSPIPFVEDLYPTCSYCGSIDVDTVLKALVTRGTHYSGCDWKYGWPHKFYIEIPCESYQLITGSRSHSGVTHYDTGQAHKRHHKFYSTHLLDATRDQLAVWNWVAAKLLGVRFAVRDDNTIAYSAVSHGFQAWGEVRGEGLIIPNWFIDIPW